MAEVVGQNGLHNVRGFLCDLCGHACDPEAQELNALDCTFGNCPKTSAVYHQDCLEKYLKSVRLEKSRKTGFRCPRGTGKGTKFPDQPCPGKIDKSHPIHIRNDNAKKRRKAQMAVQIPEPRPKPDPKEKAKVKEEDSKRVKKREQSKEEAAKPSAPGKAAAKPLSKEEKAKQENLRLLAAAQAMRRDMGLPTTAGSTKPSLTAFKSVASVNREPQTLEEYESAKAGGNKTTTAVSTAWATPKAAPKKSNPDATLQSSQASFVWASAAAASAPPPPPPSRRTPLTSAAASATRPGLKLTKAPERTAGQPVGMESATPAIEEAPKLSKAQRKNLRRAEKKAAERSQEKMSVASSEVVSELDLISNEGDALSEIPVIEEEETPTIFTHLHDDCVQALTLFKAQSLIQELRTLGFADWQCVPAIMCHGSDLETAVAFLLDGGVQTAEQAQELLNAATELPQIDIGPELTRIHHIKEELHLDLDALQDRLVQHEGDVEKACSSLFDDNHVSSPSDPSSPEDSQAQAWKHRDDDAFGSLHSDTTELDVDLGEQWDGAVTESNSLSASQQTISQDHTNLGTSWTSSFFNNGIAAVQEPQEADQQAKFDPQLVRSVRTIERYNELLGLPPPSADNKQIEQQQQQHTESLFSAIPRQPQHLPIYPNQPPAASHQSAYHHPGWNQTGGLAQHHQQDAPQAALYAAAAVTDAKQSAHYDQDLDIDKLLASLIAQ